MEICLVGGAVRDELLGRPVKERDWVVVGATPEDLEARGYRAVGRDFPVFLHPETNEEYALARLERKVAPGYRGFTTDFAPSVTLEQDLARRDLTINAMARRADGTLVDPYGGCADLAARVLRHVSPAFVEDPVRILRVARFAARFAPLGFRIAPETLALMRSMVDAGEVDALVAERVWRELERALDEPAPRAALETLRACGALGGRRRHRASTRAAPSIVRYALLAHDLGKALTPRDEWPRHHGHETRGLTAIESLSDRLRVPQEHRELALLAGRFHTHVHRGLELRASTLLEFFEAADAFRRPARFDALLETCECDARGRLGFETRPYPQRARVAAAHTAALGVTLDAAERTGLAGPAIGARLRLKRLAAIETAARGAAS